MFTQTVNFCPNCDSNRFISLPNNKKIFICPDCKTRHLQNTDGWSRDFYGEADWTKMAGYVKKSYEEVFQSEYEYALSKHNG